MKDCTIVFRFWCVKINLPWTLSTISSKALPVLLRSNVSRCPTFLTVHRSWPFAWMFLTVSRPSSNKNGLKTLRNDNTWSTVRKVCKITLTVLKRKNNCKILFIFIKWILELLETCLIYVFLFSILWVSKIFFFKLKWDQNA